MQIARTFWGMLLKTRKSQILANVVWSTFGFIVLTTMLMSWALLFPFAVVDKMFTDVKLLQQPQIYFISIFGFTVKTFFQDGFQHISAQNHGSWRMTSLFPLLAYIILFTYVYIYIYIYLFIYLHIYFNVYIYIYIYIYLHIYFNVYIYRGKSQFRKQWCTCSGGTKLNGHIYPFLVAICPPKKNRPK